MGDFLDYRRSRRFHDDEPSSSSELLQGGITRSLQALLFAGSILVLLFAASGREWARIVAVAFGVFLASGLTGGFAGFLFGLPRDAPVAPDSRQTLRFLVSSNLLKVSDFLTTLIVGLTLTQLGNVLPALGRLSDSLSAPLGANPQSQAFGTVLIVAGFTGGAMLAYIWTTVRLRAVQETSEQELILQAEQLTDEKYREVIKVGDAFIKGDSSQAELQTVIHGATRVVRQLVAEKLPEVVQGDDEKNARLQDFKTYLAADTGAAEAELPVPEVSSEPPPPLAPG